MSSLTVDNDFSKMENQVILDVNQDNCSISYIPFTNTNLLDRICRTCLTERTELRSIFNDRLTDMLMSFSSIQIEVNDGLPINVCLQCISQIIRAFNFKQQVESSDATLRQYIANFNGPSDPIPSIIEMGFDTNNLQVQALTQEVLSSDNKNGFFILNGEPLPEETNTIEKNEVIPDNILEPKGVIFKEVEFVKAELGNKIDNLEIDENDNKSGDDIVNNVDEQEDQSLSDDSSNSDSSSSESEIDEDMLKVCKVCEKKFIDEEDFNKHKKLHEKPRNHVCAECGKSFNYPVHLKTHLRTHGIGERTYLCNHCGKSFYEQSDLTIHTRTHTGERPVVCETCGKKFADPRSLTKHKKIHTGDKKYECDICQRRFIHSYTLAAHRRVHTGEKPYICSTCGHGFTTSTQLTLHTRTHTHEKPYKCSLCPKSFASRSGLSTHHITHTGERKYICNICGKGARTSTDLAAHSRTHTGEKPFECKVENCTKKYRTHSQLSAHLRTHTGEKKHKCTVCGKAFADTTQLKTHMYIHTGIKLYCCETCGQRYTQSGSLYTHMKTHHKS